MTPTADHQDHRFQCEGCGVAETVKGHNPNQTFSRYWYRLPEGWVCVWAWQTTWFACSEACARRALEIL